MSAVIEYKCPNCGGAMEFDSSSQKMKCMFCDSLFTIDEVKAFYKNENKSVEENNETPQEDIYVGKQWAKDETENMNIYSCQSCGGEIIGDKNSGSIFCPYCGSNVVVKKQFEGALRPEYVIPFKLDKEMAKDQYKKHLEGKRLMVKQFKSENYIDEIKGVYVPFWLFSSRVDAAFNYNATRVRTWSDSKYHYTETKFYDITRAGTLDFALLPVDGSEKMPDDIMESIEPFDFSEAVDFETAYLAGYFADKYDVTAQQAVRRSDMRSRKTTEDVFRSTISGYNTVIQKDSKVGIKNETAKYVLYPVWLLSSTYNNEKYMFAMNGQTGKFVGNLPLDKKAYWKWFLTLGTLSAAVTALLVFLFCNFDYIEQLFFNGLF